MCIGTSGAVLNVAAFANYAKFSILNNYEETELNLAFSKSYTEKATTAAAKIEKDIDEFFS